MTSFQCTLCNTTCSSQSNLNRHVRNQHSTPPMPSLNCLVCGHVCFDLQLHASTCTGAPSGRAPVVPLAVAVHREDLYHLTPLAADAVESCSADFLQWLGEPPLTQIEHTVKPRLLRDEKQLYQVRTNLRFLFDQALPLIDAAQLHVRQLTQLEVVEALLSQAKSRVAAGRVYQLALLLKKVCIYLCARQSATTQRFISPTVMPSWVIIAGYCHDSCKKRKLRQRDRMAFGRPASAVGTEELDLVQRACFDRLVQLEKIWGTASDHRVQYAKYFLALFMVTLLAPRQQTMRELSTDTLKPPTKPGELYSIHISAEFSKVERPVHLTVPPSVTPHLEFYLQNVLGCPEYQGPLFLQRGGVARQDFSAVIKDVTAELLGREVTAHPFRAAVATKVFEHPSSTDAMMRNLADSMNHSVEVQRSHYVYQNRVNAQQQIHRVLLEGVVSAVEEEEKKES